MTEALEWAAFLTSMLCVFLYGHTKTWGALAGLLTATLFVTWGLVAGVVAAASVNVVFFGLHSRNLYIAIKEKRLDAYVKAAHRDKR